MLIALLPSEIARLILNYLEEEKYSNTYDSFLNECRYLEECKLYLKQGISLPKTIHGKKLSDYLILESEPDKLIKKPTVNKLTQTETETCTENNFNESDKENRLEIHNCNDFSPPIPEPALTPPPLTSTSERDSVNASPKSENKSEGIECLTQLINSNDMKIDLSTETSPVPNIKLIKSPEIKLYRSPEKKIRLEIKPDIIELSSDSDDEMPIDFNNSKKRRLLIGKSVEKVPELSVSTLERQLNTIVCDATNHIKQQEEQEKQQQFIQPNSFDIINTINKGPPLTDFHLANNNTVPNQIGNHQVIGQIAQLNGLNQITQFGQIGQIGQITQIGSLGQLGQIAQIIPQQVSLPNFVQPQQVIFVSNPNDLNLSFQPKKEQQIMRLPQIANLGGINVANVANMTSIGDLNAKKAINNIVIQTKPSPILSNALKTCETNVLANVLGVSNTANNGLNSKPRILIKPANGEHLKKVEEKPDPKKEKKIYQRYTGTIKSIFEKSYESQNYTPATVSIPNETNNNIVVIENNSNSNTSSISDITSTCVEMNSTPVSAQTKVTETRNDDENVSDEILGLLGFKVSNKINDTNKDLKEVKEESKIADFDLDCIVKKSDSPVKLSSESNDTSNQDKLTKRKSTRLEAKTTDEIETLLNQAFNNNTANSTCTRTLRSRTNSQRRMI